MPRAGAEFSFQPTGASLLALNRVTISNNGSGATGGGILIQPTGAGGNARVVLQNVSLFSNANDAIRVDSTGNTSIAGIVVDIEDSNISNGTNGIVVVTPVGNNTAIVNVNDSAIFMNPGNALSVNGANSTIRVSNNTITTNGAATAFGGGGGSILSFGDNRTVGNSLAPAFTLPTQTRN